MVSIMVKSTGRAQQAFNEVVQSRLSDISSEPLIIVALAIWYEDFIPDITQLTRINEIARAGYVLEKLMTFHCVTRDVRLSITPTINELIREASSHIKLLPIGSILNVKQFSGDGLALRWRLREDIHRQVQDLLPYQGRTYTHNRE
jgi:hypothetical protein|tara:strand:+ start:576 stop:1013 length:438 start_codon:yes stop_codon:yes gene_type:complete